MSIEQSIETALFAHVRDLDLDDAPIAWPNVPFSPASPAGTYVRVQHLRNLNTRYFAKGNDPHLRQGILQLTVVAPLNVGPQVATSLAADIAAQFPADLALYSDGVKVRIQSAPDVATPEKTDASHDVRVDVRYESFA